MTQDQELTLNAALEQADDDARKINLVLINQVLADIARDEDGTE